MPTLDPPKKFNPAYYVIILLTLVSFYTISSRVIFPNVPMRTEMQSSIISGQNEPPYQYRVMKPFLGFALQEVFSLFTDDRALAHVLSYQLIILIVFFFIYYFFYSFLKLFFTDVTCYTGLLLLCMMIPLGITSYWEDGDYYTLLFFIIGLNLIFRNKEIFLPIIVLAGTFNRDQIIFLIFFYLCYVFGRDRRVGSRAILVSLLCLFSWLLVFYLLRFVFGFMDDKYTVGWNVSANLSMIPQIIELWTVMVLPFIVLCVITFKRSPDFFRYSFLCIIIYIITFFFFGFMTQLAKFLPAYLIFIPMSLQFLTNEYPGKSFLKSE